LRIDQLQEAFAGVLMVDIDHYQAARLTNLGGGQTNTGGRVHGLNHAVDQGVDAAVNVTDLLGRLFQERIRIGTYFKQRHRWNYLVYVPAFAIYRPDARRGTFDLSLPDR
jgi:hypothetical protein